MALKAKLDMNEVRALRFVITKACVKLGEANDNFKYETYLNAAFNYLDARAEGRKAEHSRLTHGLNAIRDMRHEPWFQVLEKAPYLGLSHGDEGNLELLVNIIKAETLTEEEQLTEESATALTQKSTYKGH